jgi:hypothetical protein
VTGWGGEEAARRLVAVCQDFDCCASGRIGIGGFQGCVRARSRPNQSWLCAKVFDSQGISQGDVTRNKNYLDEESPVCSRYGY